jgi:hypothetical protein
VDELDDTEGKPAVLAQPEWAGAKNNQPKQHNRGESTYG